MKNLTYKEKIKLIMGEDLWSNYDLNGQIYKFHVADATMGLRINISNVGEPKPSTAYPSAQMLSNTWNLSLAKDMGNAIANDCIENDVDVILGPGINIKRIPTNGRNFEYFSEDPFLAGQMAKMYIDGVQEKHVGTCLKHYVCNNSECSRKWADMLVDERTLREIYLEAFRIAIESKPWSVMCSYNLLNGVQMSENRKMYDILYDEFGFDGIIVSDWGAVHNVQKTVEAGLHLTMPYNQDQQEELIRLYENGELDDESLNKCAEGVLQFAKKCESESHLRKCDMTLEQRRNIALKIAEEGIVLLKNNGVLPLTEEQSCFVSGAPAFRYYCGGGSSEVVPDIPFLHLKDALVNEGINASYTESIWEVTCHQAHVGNVPKALIEAAKADVTVLAVGNPNSCEREAFNRETIKLPPDEVRLIHQMAKVSKKLVVAVYGGAAIDMADWIGEVDAVVWAGYGGQYGNKALAEVVAGKINPSGRLTETFSLSGDDVPAENAFFDGAVMKYEEELNVGYRYFNSHNVPVLFPFGFGLSYSRFEYSNINVNRSDNYCVVTFNIKNVSNINGAEVCQVYITDLAQSVYRPKRELKGFEKVFLNAGESKTVSIKLDLHAFEYYSVADKSWQLNKSTYEIAVGANVEDIKLKHTISLI